MINMRTVICLLIFISFIDCEVKLVIDIIREGASTPEYNLSLFPDITWSLSNELTAIGERQQCLLGRLRRHKYIEDTELLGKNYKPGSVYVRSTGARRTLMSAQAYLICFYPTGMPKLNKIQLKHKYDLLVPPINFTVNKEIIDQLDSDALPFGLPIIPIQNVDDSIEGLLLYNDCHYILKKVDDYFKSEQYKKLVEETEAFKALAQIHKDINANYLNDEMNAYSLAEFLIAADYAGKRPIDIESITIDGLKTFHTKVLEEIFTMDELIIKLATHDLIKEIISFTDGAISGKAKPKYILYSGHDVTLMMVLVALKKLKEDIVINKTLDFASNVLFELKDDNGLEVQVEFNGEIIYKEKYEEFKRKLLELGGDKAGCEIKPGLRTSDDYMTLPGTIEDEDDD